MGCFFFIHDCTKHTYINPNIVCSQHFFFTYYVTAECLLFSFMIFCKEDNFENSNFAQANEKKMEQSPPALATFCTECLEALICVGIHVLVIRQAKLRALWQHVMNINTNKMQTVRLVGFVFPQNAFLQNLRRKLTVA